MLKKLHSIDGSKFFSRFISSNIFECTIKAFVLNFCHLNLKICFEFRISNFEFKKIPSAPLPRPARRLILPAALKPET